MTPAARSPSRSRVTPIKPGGLLLRVLGPTALAALVWVAGCVDYSSDHAAPRATTCNAQNFGGGGAHSVVCPGTSTCVCAAPDVCCLDRIDSNQGACGSPRVCRSLALTCDGPEDCNGGVCCLDEQAGGGSTCRTAADCGGKWLCRGDYQCAGNPIGGRCLAADFGTVGVSDRGLDGLIGFCQR